MAVAVYPDIQPVVGSVAGLAFVGTLFVVEALHERDVAEHADVDVVELETGDDECSASYIVDEPGFRACCAAVILYCPIVGYQVR